MDRTQLLIYIYIHVAIYFAILSSELDNYIFRFIVTMNPTKFYWNSIFLVYIVTFLCVFQYCHSIVYTLLHY